MTRPCPQCGFENPEEATFCNRCGMHLKGSRDPLIDRLVGKYQLKKRIGGGGFGTVYRAEHVDLGNPFAVKILHPHLVSDEMMVERFRREAILLASLRHENIVQVIDFDCIEGFGFFLIMEWLDGKTLQQHLKEEGVPPLSVLISIFEQMLDALQHAHEHGVVHRDLKPENFVLIPGARGRRTLKVLDFGIARMVQQEEGSRLTETGLAVGTPRYMSPEQAAGDILRIDHRTDLYACGVILVELLTGRHIFSGSTNEILIKQMDAEPPKLGVLAPSLGYPPQLERVVERALAKDPEQRYQSAQEFSEYLFPVLESLAGRSASISQTILLENSPSLASSSADLLESTPARETPMPVHTPVPQSGVVSRRTGARPSQALIHAQSSTRTVTPIGIPRPQRPPPSSPRPPSTSTPSPQGQRSGLESSPRQKMPFWLLPAGLGMGGVLFVALMVLLLKSLFYAAPKNSSPDGRSGPSSLALPDPNKSALTLPPPPQKDPTEPKKGKVTKKQRDPNSPQIVIEEPRDVPPPPSGRRLRRRPVEKQRVRPPVKRTNRKRVVHRKRVRRRRRRRRYVVLRLRTKPAGARILINGRYRGRTPRSLRLRWRRRVRVLLWKKGYYKEKFIWKARSSTSRVVLLRPDIGI